jgi:hypothetical protein
MNHYTIIIILLHRLVVVKLTAPFELVFWSPVLREKIVGGVFKLFTQIQRLWQITGTRYIVVDFDTAWFWRCNLLLLLTRNQVGKCDKHLTHGVLLNTHSLLLYLKLFFHLLFHLSKQLLQSLKLVCQRINHQLFFLSKLPSKFVKLLFNYWLELVHTVTDLFLRLW